MAWITVKEAAEQLGVSDRRVLDYVYDKKFVSVVQRVGSPRGHYWLLETPLVVDVKSVGRPRKEKSSG
jgi:excisionase family DNA binding protein